MKKIFLSLALIGAMSSFAKADVTANHSTYKKLLTATTIAAVANNGFLAKEVQKVHGEATVTNTLLYLSQEGTELNLQIKRAYEGKVPSMFWYNLVDAFNDNGFDVSKATIDPKKDLMGFIFEVAPTLERELEEENIEASIVGLERLRSVLVKSQHQQKLDELEKELESRRD